MGEMLMPVKMSWQRLRQMILHREGGGRGRGMTDGRGASRFRSLTSRPLRLPSIILSGERQKERQQEISSAYFSWQQRKQQRGDDLGSDGEKNK